MHAWLLGNCYDGVTPVHIVGIPADERWMNCRTSELSCEIARPLGPNTGRYSLGYWYHL